MLQRGTKRFIILWADIFCLFGSLFGLWIASAAAATVLLESVYLLSRVLAGESYCLGSVSLLE